MGHSSIQVSPEMRRRLAAYKLPGMSYEEVLEVFTSAVPSDEFRARYARARVAAAQAAVHGRAGRQDLAEDARMMREERWRSMSPMDRMEEALRVSQLVRELS